MDTEAWLAGRAGAAAALEVAATRTVCGAWAGRCEASDTPYYLARWPEQGAQRQARLRALRTAGIKLRDTTSMGLPDHVRVSVQPPEAQQALRRAWSASLPSAHATEES